MSAPGRSARNTLLALDVRPHWLGYAAFQVSTRLLDFGVTNFRTHETGILRFLSILEVLRPATVVVRQITRGRRSRSATRALIRSVQGECRLRSIAVVLVSEAKLSQEFRARGATNKREDAALLAQRFTELAWKVPPPRKLWHHEHRNMPIFDAVALAISYFGKNESLQKR